MRPGALTAGLRQLGQVSLCVIRERSEGLSRDEADGIKRALRSPVWVREVLMSINGTPCVFARSLTPLGASHGTWQGIRKLRNRPLADILYHEPSIRRSDFEVARIQRHMPLYGTYLQTGQNPGAASLKLLARRSVFWRNGQPLLVSECFLPAFWRMLFAYY
jgi:chorismate--pyruvate lyase